MEREAKRALAISVGTGAALAFFYVWLALWGDTPSGRDVLDGAETDARPSIMAPGPDAPPEPRTTTEPGKKA